MTGSLAAQVLAQLDGPGRIGQVIATAVGHASSVMVNPPAADDPDADTFWAGHREAMQADRERVAGLVARHRLGGVCYFPGRLDGNPPEEVAATVAEVRAASDLPLLVSTDQEGGRVARLRGGFSLFGSALAMAATGDPAAVGEAAAVVGSELRAVGIDQVFSPVCDLNVDPANPVIGTRSYGASVAAAAPYLRAVVAGFHRAGVAATAKHFPGHGDTATDSHLGLPVIEQSLDVWRQGEGAAFATVVAAGVDAVMSGHLVMPAVADRAGTFAPEVLTGLLRDELGFTGLVVTDALGMSGATSIRPESMYVDALLAGVDQLLMPADVDAAVAQLTRALEDGTLPTERLDDACLRVLTLKERLGLLPGSSPSARPDLASVGRHTEHAVALALAAVTRRGPAAEPLAPGASVALSGPGSERFGAVLAAAGHRVDPAGRPVLLVTDTPPAEIPPGAVLLVTGLPYVAARLPADVAALLSYGDNATHLAALVRVLERPDLATGTAPVPID